MCGTPGMEIGLGPDDLGPPDGGGFGESLGGGTDSEIPMPVVKMITPTNTSCTDK